MNSFSMNIFYARFQFKILSPHNNLKPVYIDLITTSSGISDIL